MRGRPRTTIIDKEGVTEKYDDGTIIKFTSVDTWNAHRDKFPYGKKSDKRSQETVVDSKPAKRVRTKAEKEAEDFKFIEWYGKKIYHQIARNEVVPPAKAIELADAFFDDEDDKKAEETKAEKANPDDADTESSFVDFAVDGDWLDFPQGIS